MALHILLARQRSGTGALGSILDQHPEVKYLGELFHPNEISRKNSYFNFLLQKISNDVNKGLPTAHEQNYKEYMEYVDGFEVKKNVFIDVKYSSTHHFNGNWHTPFDIPKFLQFCKRDQRKIIHLKRQNFLKTYVSGKLAEQNKIWHAKNNADIAITSIKLEVKPLLQYLRSAARQVMHFEGYLKNYPNILELEYDNLLQNNGQLNIEVANDIANLLNIDATLFEKIKTAFVKQTPNDLNTVIENIEEISNLLQGSEFEWMLLN